MYHVIILIIQWLCNTDTGRHLAGCVNAKILITNINLLRNDFKYFHF